jgi:hypothetical protein
VNVLTMVYNLRDTIEQEYNTLIFHADILEALPDANGKKHAAALNDRCDTLLNQLYLLERAIKKYGRRTRDHWADTFSGLIDRLHSDPAYREFLGREIELQKLAADNWETKTGFELHEYMDGSIDPPILNWHSALLHSEREKQNERSR